jgi:hypothetical protein
MEPAVESAPESVEAGAAEGFEAASEPELPEPVEIDFSQYAEAPEHDPEGDETEPEAEAAFEVDVEAAAAAGADAEVAAVTAADSEVSAEFEAEAEASAEAKAEAGAAAAEGGAGREPELPDPFELLKNIDVEFGFTVDEKGLTFSAGVSVEVVEGVKIGVEAELPLTPPGG